MSKLRPRGADGRVRRRTKEEFIEYFWSRVKRGAANDCWEWTGPKNQKGYGELNAAGIFPGRRAHQIAYAIVYGDRPPGTHVLHSCDNPSCVNPSHLRAGTNSENMLDAFDRGRKPLPVTTKLNPDQVREIRGLVASGMTKLAVGKIYGISGRQVLSVVRGENWRRIQ